MLLHKLHDAITAAGIPINGLSYGPPLVIDFKPEATQQQRQQAQQLADAFDYRKRRPRQLAAIMQDIAALTTQQQQQLMRAVVAITLQSNPDLARKLGISLDGDEVEG